MKKIIYVSILSLGLLGAQTLENNISNDSNGSVKKISAHQNMKIEVVSIEEFNKPKKPSIEIKLSDKNSSEMPKMILEVKEKSDVEPVQVSMELVKINASQVIPKANQYPSKFLEIDGKK